MSELLDSYRVECRDVIADVGSSPCSADVDLLVGGQQFVPAILESITSAEESIVIEVFTLRKGEMASMFVAALTEQASRGVKVRLVLDAIGSRFLSSKILRALQRSGVAIQFYGRFRWSNPRQFIVRNHRKAFTIDHRVSFLGGMSIDDVFIGTNGHRAWHEVMLRIRGPMVLQIARMSDATYAGLAGEPTSTREDLETHAAHGHPAVLLQSSPGASCSRAAYSRLLRGAQKSIELTTPYFAPEDEVLRELVCAAKRGVDVRLVTAGIHTNARIVRAVAHGFYPELLRVGVRIFEPSARMSHAKTILVDKTIWIVGSTNVDGRSFNVNLEADILGCDPKVAASLSATFGVLENESNEIRLTRGGFSERVSAGCARLLARHV